MANFDVSNLNEAIITAIIAGNTTIGNRIGIDLLPEGTSRPCTSILTIDNITEHNLGFTTQINEYLVEFITYGNTASQCTAASNQIYNILQNTLTITGGINISGFNQPGERLSVYSQLPTGMVYQHQIFMKIRVQS